MRAVRKIKKLKNYNIRAQTKYGKYSFNLFFEDRNIRM